jgi:peptidoglycan/LPS O-acetylase OafA/YrhL
VIPGLAGVLLFTLLMCGWFWTSLNSGDFFRNADTWKYFYKNLLMIRTEYDLPGVFASNPYPDAVNGSLWTLRYEMKMYLALAVLGLLGFLGGNKLRLFVGVFVLWYFGNLLARLWLPEAQVSDEMLRLSLCFFLGGLAACYGARLPLHGGLLLLLALVMVLTRGSLLYDLCSALFLSYAVFYVAYIPRGRILQYNRVGDYSYGLYLYAFPIQQAVLAQWPQLGAMWVFCLASLLTLFCAAISWHLIEKPALDYCKRMNSARPVLSDTAVVAR